MIATLLALLAVVNAPYAPASFACNGSTSFFNFSFPYSSSSDLVVTSTTAAGVVTTLAVTTDYTVQSSNMYTSGTSIASVLLLAPATSCPNGNTLKIVRNVPLTQPYSFRAQTTFNPILHEQAFDRLAMQIQQLGVGLPTSLLTTKGDLLGRSTSAPVRVPVGTNGQVLTANSATASGIGWATSATACSGDINSTCSQVTGTHLAAPLPIVQGGTGAGALTCAAGQHITSNGTAYSCTADSGGGATGAVGSSCTIDADCTSTLSCDQTFHICGYTSTSGVVGSRTLNLNLSQVNVSAQACAASGTTNVGTTLCTPGWLPTITNPNSGAINKESSGKYAFYTSTLGSVGSFAGITGPLANWALVQSPVTSQKVLVTQNNGSVRRWFALTSAEISGLAPIIGTASSTTVFVGICGDANVSANFLCCSGNGTTYGCADMGVAIPLSADATMQIDATAQTSFICTANGTSVTRSTLMPAISADMGVEAVIRVLSGVTVLDNRTYIVAGHYLK